MNSGEGNPPHWLDFYDANIIIMEEKTKQWGGKREGSGRKKKATAQIGLRVPEDVANILASVEGSKTDFICEAIRFYANMKL